MHIIKFRKKKIRKKDLGTSTNTLMVDMNINNQKKLQGKQINLILMFLHHHLLNLLTIIQRNK